MNGLLLLFLTLAYVAFGQDCEEGVVKQLGKKPRLVMKCVQGKWIAIEGRGGPGAPPCQDDPALAANGTCEKDRAECLQYSQKGQQLDRDCPGTCGSCDKCACRDNSQWHKFCHWWAQYCDSPGVLGSWMTSNCRKTCKKCSCKCCSYQGKQHQLGAEILLPDKCGKLLCVESLKAGPSPLVSGAFNHIISHPEELTMEFVAVQEGANCCMLTGPAVSEDGNRSENGSMVAEGWKGNLNIFERTLPATCCHGILSVPLQNVLLGAPPTTTSTTSTSTTSTSTTSTSTTSTSTTSTSTISTSTTSTSTRQDQIVVVKGYNFKYFPWTQPNFYFKAQATSDVHILFASGINSQPSGYMIVIGGWTNSQSEIRRIKQGTTSLSGEAQTPGILSPSEFRGFWITTELVNSKLQIKVGKDGESVPFMTGVDNTPLQRNYVATGSWGSYTATYKF